MPSISRILSPTSSQEKPAATYNEAGQKWAAIPKQISAK